MSSWSTEKEKSFKKLVLGSLSTSNDKELWRWWSIEWPNTKFEWEALGSKSFQSSQVNDVLCLIYMTIHVPEQWFDASKLCSIHGVPVS